MKKPTHQSERNPLGAFISEYRWSLVGILAILAFVLGFLGLQAHYTAIGQPRSWPDTVYLALQLFVLEFGAEGPFPWPLEVARFLAPLVLTYTALTAVLAIFRDQVQLLRARWLRGHIVICGLGEKGFLFARALRRASLKVVVIENNPDNDHIKACRRAGAFVLIGNALYVDNLRAARLDRADSLIAVCGDDGANAQIAVRARELVHDPRGDVLTGFIHISDRRLRRLLEEKEFTTQAYDRFRLEFFNIYEQGARELITEYPPFDIVHHAHNVPGRDMLIIGLDDLGGGLVLEAVRLWRDAETHSGQRLKITIVDTDAERKWALLAELHPTLATVCDADLIDVDLGSAEFQSERVLRDTRRLSATCAYVCMADEAAGLSAALMLRQLMSESDATVVVCMKHDGGLAELLDHNDDSDNAGVRLEAFGLLDRTCTANLLESGMYERIARHIHAAFVEDQKGRGNTPQTKPSMRDWAELSMTFRKANRRQADHIKTKLRAIGCDLRHSTNPDNELLSFSDAEVELMAEMEHERWNEEREADGWTHGERNDGAKTTPYLVPWADLEDEIRDYDRDAVRNMPDLLAKAGFEIFRVRRQK
jgi:hypothetical protein